MSRVDRPPTVAPVFPLLLLETVRELDRPEEVLEDENLTESMPRRFGLSDVVEVQIRRFREAVRQGRRMTEQEVEDLVRLMIRRPDAGEIFHAAGLRVAEHAWEKRSAPLRGSLRFMPGPLAVMAANRAARRLFRDLIGGARLKLNRWPVELSLRGSLSARADGSGTACRFYSGVLEETLRRYTGRSYRAHHSRCEAHGAEACEWEVRLRE